MVFLSFQFKVTSNLSEKYVEVEMSVASLAKLDGLDVTQGLRNCMDDESLYLSIVEMFITQLKQNLGELQQQFESNEWIGYGKTCHSIKGASASVGATAIQSFSSELEAAGKLEDDETITTQHINFIELLKKTIEDIEPFF